MEHHEEAEDEPWIYDGKRRAPRTVRRVRIAENVIEIPDETFKKHPQLEEVLLSSSVQVIGVDAFRCCEKLKSILYQGIQKEGLERIGEYSFYSCHSLTEVHIPSTVKVIDNGAFDTCKLLARLGLNEGLKRIGKWAFSYCEYLTEVHIPFTVEVIDVGSSISFCHSVP
eukprot:scaffold10160_cov79-Cylindrotheca_fusiformis.AAC.3